MRTFTLLALFCAACFAQQKGAPKGPPAPPLMACGDHKGADILCGTHSPEDIELTPDGKFLIVAQMVRDENRGLMLFDIGKKTYGKLPITDDPRKDWGDPSCPGPIGSDLSPHGISLAKRTDKAMELFVVNHGGRQSIEMYELKPLGPAWVLSWHGCVPTMAEFNDVAAMPDGGFIATHPTSIQTAGGNANLFSGQPSGWVVRWTPGNGEVELPGTRAGYPNGVLVSADGRTMYFNAWTAKEVHRYDLRTNKETGVVKLDFMPDNITWTDKHQILAAGVKGANGDCAGAPCIQGFEIAQLDPEKWKTKTIYDSAGKAALISGVSVALEVGDSIYIGAFQGDRLVKIKK